jgi:hypothetical protein
MPPAQRTAGRAVKCGEKAIPGGVDLPTAKTSDVAAHQRVMAVERVVPAAVAQVRGLLGCADYAVNSTVASTRSSSSTRRAPVRILDLFKYGVAVAEPWEVIGAVQSARSWPMSFRAPP